MIMDHTDTIQTKRSFDTYVKSGVSNCIFLNIHTCMIQDYKHNPAGDSSLRGVCSLHYQHIHQIPHFILDQMTNQPDIQTCAGCASSFINVTAAQPSTFIFDHRSDGGPNIIWIWCLQHVQQPLYIHTHMTIDHTGSSAWVRILGSDALNPSTFTLDPIITRTI